MLPRRFRLTERRDFDKLYRSGERFSAPHFLIRVLPNNRTMTRIAVVMSTKVSKRATVRNRYKRQTRAVLEELLPRLPGGWDIFVTIRRLVLSSDEWIKVREELRELFVRRFLS